jgi:hypothetical protein
MNSSGVGQFFLAHEFCGTVENDAQIHERAGGAGGTFAVGVAHAIAVKAKYGMVQRNGRIFHKSGHRSCFQNQSCFLLDEHRPGVESCDF